jgi:hypothetical protein
VETGDAHRWGTVRDAAVTNARRDVTRRVHARLFSMISSIDIGDIASRDAK